MPSHLENWTDRGRGLAELGLPELAMGDAFKAQLLIQAAQA